MQIFFFQLNLLPLYSLRSQGDKQNAITGKWYGCHFKKGQSHQSQSKMNSFSFIANLLYLILLVEQFTSYSKTTKGVAWSSSQRRRLPLQGSRVRTPAVLKFFVANIVRATARRDVKIPSARKTARRSREDEGGSGERRRKDQQANEANGREKG